MAESSAVLSVKDLGLPNLDDDEEPLDVLDLPQLYQKPSASMLLAVLDDLSFTPPSWDATPRSTAALSRDVSGTATPVEQRRRRKVRREGVPQYLTRIISSPLAWITDDEEKESVWEAAALRMSERSGRTGMAGLSRAFAIPLRAPASAVDDPNPEDVVEITLHEPALTADNLGNKTWASSYLLAKRLCLLRPGLPSLSSADTIVLELGSGTGLVGLAAAAVLGVSVILTDLPDIVPNLERNRVANQPSLDQHGCSVDATTLDWTMPGDFAPKTSSTKTPHSRQTFSLILVADPIYSSEHPAFLVNAIEYHMAPKEVSRLVIELPLREAYAAERRDLRDRLAAIGLVIDQEGEEVGFDDWGASGSGRGACEDELAEVTCWWSVWKFGGCAGS